MPSYTTLLEVQLEPGSRTDSCEKTKDCIRKELDGLGLKLVYQANDQEDICMHFSGASNCRASVQSHGGSLLVIDLHEYQDSPENCRYTEEVVTALETTLKTSLNGKKSLSLPAVRRGDPVQCYYPTVDRKLIEYDFDRTVFEGDSPYQNVKIMHSPQFGNMLLLDDDPNLAESDLLYTEAITGSGREDYRDRTVLVLGGGDGGILHELLKQQPKHITMVDIDDMVVSNAPKYLRGICHDALDKLKGDNYEVLVEDCVPVLEQYRKEGRVFDFVINDLTAIPCSPTPVGDQWDFLRRILELSMSVLATTGVYYTQGNGWNSNVALGLYEEQLQKLPTPVTFSKTAAFVPSYHEKWVFYRIRKINT